MGGGIGCIWVGDLSGQKGMAPWYFRRLRTSGQAAWKIIGLKDVKLEAKSTSAISATSVSLLSINIKTWKVWRMASLRVNISNGCPGSFSVWEAASTTVAYVPGYLIA